MIEHFHHRERIADLMSNFRRKQTERGELVVLAQLFLDIDDALIESRLLDGDRRKLSQRGENPNFFVSETVRLAVIDTEGPDCLPGEYEGDTEKRHQPFAPGNIDMLVAAGDLDIFNLQRLF